jgi:membrane-associated protease RseP (regulator of RpoE activity)
MNEVHWPPRDPLEWASTRLRSELHGLFMVEDVAVKSDVIVFSGRFQGESERSYAEISRRFAVYSYTPTAEIRDGRHHLVALPGVIKPQPTGNPLVNLALLATTIFTTLAAWSFISTFSAGDNLYAAILAGDREAAWQAVRLALPFTMTLLGILGVHELGHYLAARWHGVSASLPYFIPLPLIGLGTLGAFISIKSPIQNRKALFDIGVSGPFAGFLVALPLLFIGLTLSEAAPLFSSGLTLQTLGSSLFVDVLVNLFYDLPANQTLSLHPIFFAAWLGLLLTGMNLLPVGQLDGGHVSYALFGRYAHWLAVVTFLGLLVAGYLLTPMWYIWAFFVLISGLRHGPTLNDVTSPDVGRRLLGAAAAILFITTIVPTPFP